MRCLVTGGAGFIGSHVTDALIEAGHEVIVLDNLSTGKLENINQKARFVNGDICDPDVYRVLNDVDVVYHLAALARIQPSIENPVESHEVNLTGTLLILQHCRKNQAKLVFSSSSSIYAGLELPTDENSEIVPKNPYAMQKFFCEEYIKLFGELYGLDYAILRYFNVYGERQILEGAYAALIGIFLDEKKNGQKLTITNDGQQRRDFTYVKDVARANLMAMEWQGIFNIGTGKNYSVNEIAALVGGETEFIGDRVGEARETLADNGRAVLNGWRPTKDIKDWISEKATA